MARKRKHDDDKKKHKKHEPKPKPSSVPPAGDTGGQCSEDLKAKSTQTSDQAMNAVPESREEAEEGHATAVYSTGPGAVVAYEYRREGTWADQYADEQQVKVQGGTPMVGATPTAAAMGG